MKYFRVTCNSDNFPHNEVGNVVYVKAGSSAEAGTKAVNHFTKTYAERYAKGIGISERMLKNPNFSLNPKFYVSNVQEVSEEATGRWRVIDSDVADGKPETLAKYFSSLGRKPNADDVRHLLSDTFAKYSKDDIYVALQMFAGLGHGEARTLITQAGISDSAFADSAVNRFLDKVEVGIIEQKANELGGRYAGKNKVAVMFNIPNIKNLERFISFLSEEGIKYDYKGGASDIVYVFNTSVYFDDSLMDSELVVGKTFTTKSGHKLKVTKVVSGYSEYNGNPEVSINYDYEKTDGSKGSAVATTKDFFNMMQDSKMFKVTDRKSVADGNTPIVGQRYRMPNLFNSTFVVTSVSNNSVTMKADKTGMTKTWDINMFESGVRQGQIVKDSKISYEDGDTSDIDKMDKYALAYKLEKYGIKVNESNPKPVAEMRRLLKEKMSQKDSKISDEDGKFAVRILNGAKTKFAGKTVVVLAKGYDDAAKKVCAKLGINEDDDIDWVDGAEASQPITALDSKMFKVTDKKTGVVRLARAADGLDAVRKVSAVKDLGTIYWQPLLRYLEANFGIKEKKEGRTGGMLFRFLREPSSSALDRLGNKLGDLLGTDGMIQFEETNDGWWVINPYAE